MDHVYWLDQIQPSERYLVGDKAFYLSQLAQQDYPVVPGFVVAAPALREFLDNYQWEEPLFAELLNSSLHLNVDDARQLKAIAQHIRQEITEAELPREWVRQIVSAAQMLRSPVLIFQPSVTLPASAATGLDISGLLESYVCLCDPEEIALAILQTWAELFRARSLFYWQQSEIQLQELNLAVFVQPVWSAIAAGNLQHSEAGFEIQATWGLGISIPLGQVIPDYYLLDRDTHAAIAQNLGNKHLAYDLVFNHPGENLKADTSVLSTYSCLQPYPLSEEKQNQLVLAPNQLQTLIQIAQPIADLRRTSSFGLEWILAAKDEDSSPRLYLTGANLSYRPLAIPTQNETVQKPAVPPPEPENTEGEKIADPIVGIGAAKGEAIAPAYTIAHQSDRPDNVPTGQVIVAPEIAPQWLHIVRTAAALITERGGMTSHAAILARELGIPAVVGAPGVTHLIQTGDRLFVSGDTGEIYRLANPDVGGPEDVRTLSPNPKDSEPSVRHSSAITPKSESFSGASLLVSQITSFPIATQLLVNLSHLNALKGKPELPVDGVGLLRSETIALDIFQSQHPRQWVDTRSQSEFIETIAARVNRVAEFFFPRPVFYRSLDLRAYYPALTPNPKQARKRSPEFSSPVINTSPQTLGPHGAFSYLLDPLLFDLELQAVAQLQKAGYTNLHLILPFVRTVEEFTFCRRRVEAAGLTQIPGFQLWIMAEVPSVVFLLPDYVKAGVQGISIGTNDLTQLLLAADRDDKQMSMAFQARHPAVMRAIHQLISLCKQAGIPCSICCGSTASYPDMIDDLVRSGITSISVEPDALERTYLAIARAEQRILLEAARQQLHKPQS